MESFNKHKSKSFTPTTRATVFGLIAHLRDPETGERLIDDPAFQAAAGLKKKIEQNVA